MRDEHAESLTLLSRLKHDTTTRHIPTAVITRPELKQQLLSAGAAIHRDEASTPSQIEEILDRLEAAGTPRHRQMGIANQRPCLSE